MARHNQLQKNGGQAAANDVWNKDKLLLEAGEKFDGDGSKWAKAAVWIKEKVGVDRKQVSAVYAKLLKEGKVKKGA